MGFYFAMCLPFFLKKIRTNLPISEKNQMFKVSGFWKLKQDCSLISLLIQMVKIFPESGHGVGILGNGGNVEFLKFYIEGGAADTQMIGSRFFIPIAGFQSLDKMLFFNLQEP